MNLQRLKRQALGLHRSAPCPRCLCYSFQFGTFMELLSVWLSRCVICVPSLGLLPFCWFALSYTDVMVFVYLIIFYFFLKKTPLKETGRQTNKQKQNNSISNKNQNLIWLWLVFSKPWLSLPCLPPPPPPPPHPAWVCVWHAHEPM